LINKGKKDAPKEAPKETAPVQAKAADAGEKHAVDNKKDRTVRKYTYRGFSLEDLSAMKNEKLMELFCSR